MFEVFIAYILHVKALFFQEEGEWTVDEILATLDTFPYSPHTKEPMEKRFVLKRVFMNQNKV